MQKTIFAIDYPFAVDRGLGQLAVQTDYARHVEQLMRQLLFTNPGERVNRPEFGCGIRRMVFAPNSQESASLARVTIYQALEKWLHPVIQVEDVAVTAQDERLHIKIQYVLKVRREQRYLNIEVNL